MILKMMVLRDKHCLDLLDYLSLLPTALVTATLLEKETSFWLWIECQNSVSCTHKNNTAQSFDQSLTQQHDYHTPLFCKINCMLFDSQRRNIFLLHCMSEGFSSTKLKGPSTHEHQQCQAYTHYHTLFALRAFLVNILVLSLFLLEILISFSFNSIIPLKSERFWKIVKNVENFCKSI